MIRYRKYIFIVGLLLLILGVSYYYNTELSNAKQRWEKESQAQLKNYEEVPLTRKEYNMVFEKAKTTFTSEAVEVFKDKTLNKMGLSFDASTKDKLLMRVYQNDKLIKEFKNDKASFAYEVPFKMDFDKCTFKIQVDWLEPLVENEKVSTKFVWYVNKSF